MMEYLVRKQFSIALACLVFSACATPERNTWENLDYKSVYKRAQSRENDPFYQQPTTTGCLDDDLYNCGR
jgi:hypothetical protein